MRRWSAVLFFALHFPTRSPSNVALPVPTDSNGTNYQMRSAPYNMQWNLSVQREIVMDTILNVAYVGMGRPTLDRVA